jgi:poly(A) polymerase
MTTTIPQRKILERIRKALPGGTVYLVGGTVRDLLLKRKVTDIDVVITGYPMSGLKKRLRRFGNIATLGEVFGTLRLTLPSKTFHIDIALPRTERSGGTGGYKDFSFRPDHRLPIEEDLSRRDFTMNAMALRISDGTLIDPFHGEQDVRRRILRTVGKPEDRFREDYSRLLRLLRFSVSLGCSVDHRTAAAARRLMPRLNSKNNGRFIVPREVVAEQCILTFAAHPLRAFEAYDRFSVFRVCIPEVEALKGCRQPDRFHSEGDVFAHTRDAMQKISRPEFQKYFHHQPPPLTIFAVLLHDIGKPRARRIVHEHEGKRIHFWGHETRGAIMAQHIGERLRLASYKGLVQPNDLAWIIRRHLIVTTHNPSSLRASTIAEYFCGRLGPRLLEVVWADQSASKPSDGARSTARFVATRKRLRALFGRSGHRGIAAPQPLLTGNDVMKLFRIPEGQRVGSLLRILREEQLSQRIRTRSEAIEFLSKMKNTQHV